MARVKTAAHSNKTTKTFFIDSSLQVEFKVHLQFTRGKAPPDPPLPSGERIEVRGKPKKPPSPPPSPASGRGEKSFSSQLNLR
jgi:hypothetical protein